MTTKTRYSTPALDVESVLSSARYCGMDIHISPTLFGLRYMITVEGAEGYVFMEDNDPTEEPLVEFVNYYTGDSKKMFGPYTLEAQFLDMLPEIAAVDLVGNEEIDAIRTSTGTRWILFDRAVLNNKGDVLVYSRKGSCTYLKKTAYVTCKWA